MHALQLSKELSQNGYESSTFLKYVHSELRRATEDLILTEGTTERKLADFLEAAMQEISISRYLEDMQSFEHQNDNKENEIQTDDSIVIVNPT